VVQTNVPAGELGTMTDLALDSKKLPVSSFSPVPPLIHTGDPDFALVRSKVAEAIGKSEALDKAASDGNGKKSNTPSKAPSKPAKPSGSPSKPSTDVDDVASICKA
jgi:hypothetical protein